jgi:hypothetical protein
MGATQIVDGVEVRHRLTVRRSIASKCEANASPHQTDQRRRIWQVGVEDQQWSM